MGKRSGISWILQNTVSNRWEEMMPECKLTEVVLNERYWSRVDILFDITTTRFVEL